MVMHMPQELYGLPVLSSDNESIGKIDEILLDDATERPEWAAVKTGRFSHKMALVPLANAERTKDGLRVPYPKELVTSAPQFGVDDGLEVAEEEQLFTYYGLPYGGPTATATGPATTGPATATTTGAGTGIGQPAMATPRAGTGGDAMTRSEERLRVGVEQREAGRARLRKYVVTENVATTVPVRHEEVRLEREPITGENREAALSGPPIGEAEHEVVLHEDRPVVQTEAVPVERVRLSTDQVVEEEQVGGEIRKEQIELEDKGRRAS